MSQNDWVLFIDNDEEPSGMLLDYLNALEPKFPYYWIRRINLYSGRYRAAWNPDLTPRLVSNRVRFVGRVHERIVPKDPHGKIDFPIIHNHVGGIRYKNFWYEPLPIYRLWLGIKKGIEVVMDR